MPFVPTERAAGSADADRAADRTRRTCRAAARFARCARIVLSAAALCLFRAGADTVRTESDLRLWQTVHDRLAPLEWPWEDGADSATLVFSNRMTKVQAAETVARGEGEARGSFTQPAPETGETLVDVTLVQTGGGIELARWTATLAYVDGAGGGPVEVRANPGTSAWMRIRSPRVYAYDPAWTGEAGDSGYDIFRSVIRGLAIILK